MIFNYIEHSTLAKLAWGAILKDNSEIIDVHVGTSVETRNDFFVAGVWDGDFEKGEFDKAEFFCGTGIKLMRGGVKVVCPSHERERILFLKKKEIVYISNSLPMLLAISQEELDKNCDQYEQILCSIIEGLVDYQKHIPLKSGNNACQVFCADILIDSKCNVQIQKRNKHRDFNNFDDYYNSLLKVCASIRDNGASKARKISYGLVSTVSSGYDSSAASAIAHELGCETACTFCGGKYDLDSGREVAKQLEYKNIIERFGTDYKTRSSDADACSVCAGDMGSNLQFVAFADVFENNIVFMGTCGDTAYGKEVIANSDLKRYGVPFYQANIGHIENAITTGYIVLPMPLYALTAHASIQKITNSEEMKPWTLNNDYDRPIPRRICELNGVDRKAFGFEKHGAGISFSRNFTQKQIRQKMSEAGYIEFMEWLSQNGNNSWKVKRLVHNIKYHYYTLPDYISYIKMKLHIESTDHRHHEKTNPYANPGLPSRMLIWGIEKIAEKYTCAMTK